MRKFMRNLDIASELVDDGIVFYNQNRSTVVFLNATAASILHLTDTESDETAIAEALQMQFALDQTPHEDVRTCLDALVEQGLLFESVL